MIKHKKPCQDNVVECKIYVCKIKNVHVYKLWGKLSESKSRENTACGGFHAVFVYIVVRFSPILNTRTPIVTLLNFQIVNKILSVFQSFCDFVYVK